ncbi:MAG TPA: response regulator [Longimicrobiales bacterium]|jgi:DNA-binding NtrC family response regulator
MALILIVEDDQQLLRAACRALERHGHEVMVAANADEVERRLQMTPRVPDVVLMDLVLPGVGGRELARHLQTVHERMAVVFMSGYPGRVAQELGAADRFLRKPFSVPDLLHAVEGALETLAKEERA